MPTWNQDVDVALLFKAVFGIYDTTDFSGSKFNFDEIVEVEVNVIGDFEKYYSATGKKRLKTTGDSSTFRLRVKKTSDLYDTADPPTNIRTISYFKKKLLVDRVAVAAAWEGVAEAESVSNKFIREQFKGVITRMDDVRNPDTGALEVEISGEITEWTKQQRAAA